jgi:hypothetical protein
MRGSKAKRVSSLLDFVDMSFTTHMAICGYKAQGFITDITVVLLVFILLWLFLLHEDFIQWGGFLGLLRFNLNGHLDVE